MNDSMRCPVCDNCKVVHSIKFHEKTIFRCDKCLAEFFENCKESKSHLYSQSYYNSWNLKEKGTFTEKIKYLTFKDLLSHIEKRCDEFRGKRLLDIGCATGYMMDVAKEKGCEVYGVELSTWACDQARRRHRNVLNKPLAQCFFKDSFFDIVSLTDLLEHIGYPHHLFKEIKRILKPGGYILITTPDNSSWSRRIMGKKWFQFKDEHVIYYNKKALSNICNLYGFEIIEVRANRKIMCFNYLHTQFMSYRVLFISELIALIYKLLPKGLCNVPFKVPVSGEFLAVLRKA